MQESDALRRLLRRCTFDSVPAEFLPLLFYLGMPWSHLKTIRPCKIRDTEHMRTRPTALLTAVIGLPPTWIAWIFIPCCLFFSCEARLRSQLWALGAWLDCFVWNSRFDLDMFGNLVEAFWNLLVNLLWLLNCRGEVLRVNSRHATLKLAIYLGRMAVVVGDISVLFATGIAAYSWPFSCIVQICKGDWSKETMNPYESMVDFDAAGRMRRSTSVAVRLDVPVILSTAQKG